MFTWFTHSVFGTEWEGAKEKLLRSERGKMFGTQELLWERIWFRSSLPLILGRGLQTLHGAVKGDLALVVFVHTLLMLQALFSADAGGLGTVAVDVLRALGAVHQQQNEGGG